MAFLSSIYSEEVSVRVEVSAEMTALPAIAAVVVPLVRRHARPRRGCDDDADKTVVTTTMVVVAMPIMRAVAR